jgi:hypothetical protein
MPRPIRDAPCPCRPRPWRRRPSAAAAGRPPPSPGAVGLGERGGGRKEKGEECFVSVKCEPKERGREPRGGRTAEARAHTHTHTDARHSRRTRGGREANKTKIWEDKGFILETPKQVLPPPLTKTHQGGAQRSFPLHVERPCGRDGRARRKRRRCRGEKVKGEGCVEGESGGERGRREGEGEEGETLFLFFSPRVGLGVVCFV